MQLTCAIMAACRLAGMMGADVPAARNCGFPILRPGGLGNSGDGKAQRHGPLMEFAMSEVGRPSLYMTKHADQAYKLCLLGATDAEMADIFEVSESTLNLWKQQHPEFSESITRGKAVADSNVAEKLYQRACGYSHPAVKIFMPQGAAKPVYAEYTENYPPDTQAASLWLRNRQPKKWRDKQDIENKTTISVADPIAELLGQIAAQGAKIYDPRPT
jgi:hypothetical protein